jgi:hypothetical protein
MSSMSRAKADPHARRLRVDEAEWRDRLNQLADMRRGLAVMPVAAGQAIVTAPSEQHGNTTASG